MSAFATLCRQLAVPGRLTEELVGFAITALCRDGTGLVEACDLIADGQIDLNGFLGHPPVKRSGRTLRRHFERWRARAWHQREPDLRARLLRSLGLPEERMAEVMAMFPIAEITLGDVAATEAVAKRTHKLASMAKHTGFLATDLRPGHDIELAAISNLSHSEQTR